MRQPTEEIPERLREIRERVRESAEKSGRSESAVRILAVTKTVPPESVNLALSNGIEWIGENRVQEFLEKREAYRAGPENTHFIGHLQSNKVKYIIDKVSMIESLSSIRLAEEINRRADAAGRTMEVLLEINIAAEESKSGFLPEEAAEAAEAAAALPNLRVRGMMCIPQRDRGEYWFEKARELYESLRARRIPGAEFTWLSMGMSADYESAILCGSNLIRLGSAIFGERK